MSDKPVHELIQRARSEGLELYLWRGQLVWKRTTKVSTVIKSELLRRTREVRDALVREFATERVKPNLAHKWVIRLGDAPKAVPCRPARLACGPQTWFMRMIRQASEFGETDEERGRWMILEPDQVGAPIWDERGVLVASLVNLPSGVELGGPKGALAEILSACEGCLAPPIDDERMKEILKNEE